MRHLKTLSIILLTLSVMTSCGSKGNKSREAYLPNISGKSGDILVVVDKSYWEGEVGSAIRDVFMADYPFLPQKEAYFSVYNCPHSLFKGNYSFYRNILMINIGKKVDSSSVAFKENVWARPQLVITIDAKDKDEAISLFTQNQKKMVSAIEQKERDRIIHNSKRFEDASIKNTISKQFGGSPTFPKDYSLKKISPSFIWVSHETTYVNQGIFIYKIPYTEPSNLTFEYLSAKIDSTLQVNVPGMRDQSFMTISKLILPGIGYVRYQNRDFIEIRGLWELTNDFMGGPFVCHAFADKANKNIILLQGFVYAPKFDKRNYLRYVESILYSFEWSK